MFLIFGNEDTGFGAGQEPSGYVKIEVRDGKGRLTLSVSNLKEDLGKTDYRLYIIKFDNRQCVPALIGDLIIKRNKCEMAWELDAQNVNSSQVAVDEFNIAAVVAKDLGKGSNELVCPLVAYRGEKVNWRDKAKALIYPAKPDQTVESEDISIKQDVFSKYQGNITSKYTGLDKFGVNVQKIDKGYPEGSKDDTYSIADTSSDNDTSSLKEYKSEKYEHVKCESGKYEPEKYKSEEYEPEKYKSGKCESEEYEPEECKSGKCESEEYEPEKYESEKYKLGESDTGKIEVIKPDKGNPGKDNGSPPSQNKAFDPCVNCPVKNTNNYTQDETLYLDNLKGTFDRCFEVFNPFRSSRKNYTWWKTDNPASLNNILYSFNLKNPLLFNPRVLMAYYKYRHLAVGIFEEITGSRKYIVCGIPAVYGVDDRPFGSACKWGQTEGSRARYGFFGYWLVYLDIKTGRIIN